MRTNLVLMLLGVLFLQAIAQEAAPDEVPEPQEASVGQDQAENAAQPSAPESVAAAPAPVIPAEKPASPAATQQQDAVQKTSVAPTAQPAKPQEGKTAAQQPAEANKSTQQAQTAAPAGMAAASATANQEQKVVAVQPVKAAAPVEPQPIQVEQEVVNIDNIDLTDPKGNWLLKRLWWERSEALYEKIKQLVEQVIETRTVFDNQRTELERKVFTPFYQQVGIGQGELQEIISDLSRQADRYQKDKQIDLEDEAQQAAQKILALLAQEKENLEALQKNISLVVEYDHAIDEALIKLREQINIARRYEAQAWNAFKEIARELSDKRAAELYYTIKTLKENISNINDYIKNPFAKYFVELVQKVKSQVDIISASVQSLKEKGIDLKAEAEKLDQQSSQSQPETSDKQEQEEQGFLGLIWSWISWPFIKIVEGFGFVFGGLFDGMRGIFGSTPATQDEE